MITQKQALEIIKLKNGMIRTSEALAEGISPKTFYTLIENSILTQMKRGLYRLSDLPPLNYPEIVTVSKSYPKAIVCLLSALELHQLTEEIPKKVYIAIPQGTREPKIHDIPIESVWLSQHIYRQGIIELNINSTGVKCYSPEKTLADMFKFRNKVGLQTAIDAMRQYLQQPNQKINLEQLAEYARLDRVHRIMQPYIEALQ